MQVADEEAGFNGSEQMDMPLLGFGTFQMGGDECFNAVRRALEVGYRHIDTGMAYENEAEVGRAIEASGVDRGEVFLTTKVKGYPEMLEHDQLIESVENSLLRLGTDYVDLLLVHWWNPLADMNETFEALNHLVDRGKVRHIGVSNFSVDQLRAAMAVSDEPIYTNQVEHHVYWRNDELLSFCQEHDIVLTAYSPLAEGLAVNDNVLSDIGDRHGKTAAQVAIQWLIQQEGVATIPKTATRKYARENFDVFDFRLSDEEMETIDDLEGPFWYTTNREGGAVHRLRGIVGPLLPSRLLARLQ